MAVTMLKPGKDRATTEWLVVGTLSFDDRIQRPLNQSRAATIARDFNPDAVGLITVNERPDGVRAVIDGMHRVEALKLMGWESQKVECRVFKGLTLQQEAQLFLDLNKTARVQPIVSFLRRVTAAEGIACTINDIARSFGLVIDGQPGDGHLAAVVAVERVYRGDRGMSKGTHPKVLKDTLKVITDAWGPVATGLNGDIILGVGLLFHRYGKAVDSAVLTNKLASLTGGPAGLLGLGRTYRSLRGGTVAQAVAGAVVDLYNKGRRTHRLGDWWNEAA